MDEMLTVEEIARTCRLHEMTIRRHIAEGKLKAVRVGKRVRVRKEDLEAYMTPAVSGGKQADRHKSRPRGQPITADDSLWNIVGIASSKRPTGVSGRKYDYFTEAFGSKE